MYFSLSECLADQLAVSQLDEHVSTALKRVVYVCLCHSSLEMPFLIENLQIFDCEWNHIK